MGGRGSVVGGIGGQGEYRGSMRDGVDRRESQGARRMNKNKQWPGVGNSGWEDL